MIAVTELTAYSFFIQQILRRQCLSTYISNLVQANIAGQNI
jgi:hypothetical protein